MSAMVATSARGTNWRACPSLAGRGTCRRPIASVLDRISSGKRTTMSNRRSPSNIWPAVVPPIEVEMTDCTSFTLKPNRAMAVRSGVICSSGRPVTCSV